MFAQRVGGLNFTEIEIEHGLQGDELLPRQKLSKQLTSGESTVTSPCSGRSCGFGEESRPTSKEGSARDGGNDNRAGGQDWAETVWWSESECGYHRAGSCKPCFLCGDELQRRGLGWINSKRALVLMVADSR